jgi:hypothetical protein
MSIHMETKAPQRLSPKRLVQTGLIGWLVGVIELFSKNGWAGFAYGFGFGVVAFLWASINHLLNKSDASKTILR